MAFGIGALCFLLAAGTPAFAQAKPELVAKLTAQKVTLVNGKEARTPAEVARPGEVIEYRVSYQNQSGKELRNVQPLLPIPVGSAFVAEALQPIPVEASVDGTTFGSYPLKRSVVAADGTTQVIDVPLSEYRALRWSIPTLAPKATSSINARVRVLTNPAPTAAR